MVFKRKTVKQYIFLEVKPSKLIVLSLTREFKTDNDNQVKSRKNLKKIKPLVFLFKEVGSGRPKLKPLERM